MIRKLQQADMEQVMEIWLWGNLDAHPFIPGEYWRSNLRMVQEQLPQAEVYVYAAGEWVQGFVGVVEGYIAGIFVDGKCRSTGIGRQLLNHVKERYPTLTLGVYQKNCRAVAFYIREGFAVASQQIDEATGETEYTMAWNA